MGRIAIYKGEFGGEDDSKKESKIVLYKVVFRNVIGKTLYDANISGKHSKFKKIPEKAYKNQLKIAVVQKVEVEEEGKKKWTHQL